MMLQQQHQPMPIAPAQPAPSQSRSMSVTSPESVYAKAAFNTNASLFKRKSFV